MSFFDGTEREVGKGAQATVFYYKGFAYKVYNSEYPKEWINCELLIQEELNKTSLSVVKYYRTEELNVVKMDFIDGITLGERMQKEKYKKGVDDVIKLQKEINSIINMSLPTLKSFAANDINQLQINQKQRETALKFLEEIEEKTNLLHLDLHFLNIMYSNSKYYVVDWINARVGNPIYDYARSYVIMNEFVYRAGKKYLSLVTKDKEIDTTDFEKAVYVMALLRTKEKCNEKTSMLIQEFESKSPLF